jgi:4-amino-4-deoxy-L-arabinose transferase-like glycosyltransferase
MSGAMRTAVFGGLVAAIATLPGLGTGTLWDNSETAYGEVAREILLTHDWVVMHLNLTPWFVQPPLYFWIAAAFAKIFGVGSFALRLPSALATVAMGAAIGYATTTLAGSRVGMYGAVVLSTSLMQAVIGRMAIMDALLDLAVAIGILALFRAFTGGRPVLSVLGASIAIAFGILAKGPVAFVVVALVIVPWFLWERYAGARLTYPPVWSWFAALALLLAIDTPWFALLVSRAGPPAFDMLIGHYTFGRYVGTIENQSGPIWYYIPVVILGFFPWIAYLPGAIAVSWRHARTPNGLSVHVARLALVWSIVPFVFFSLASTKLPNYVALELPALAILVALWFDQLALGERRRSALIATAVIPLTIGAVAIAIALFARDAHLIASTEAVIGDLATMGAIVFVGSIFTLAFLWMHRAETAPYIFAATAIVMVTYAILVAEPHAERFKPVPQLAAIIRAHAQAADAVAIQGVAGGNGLIFYTHPHVNIIGANADARGVICSANRTFLITSTQRADTDAIAGREKHVVATSGNDVLLLFTSPRPEPARC